MANNCLHKTFMGVLPNSTRDVLGSLTIKVNPSNEIGEIQVRFPTNQGTKCTFVGTGHFTDSTGASDLGTTIDYAPTVSGVQAKLYLTTNSDGYVYITNKYNATFVMINHKRFEFDISQFGYNYTSYALFMLGNYSDLNLVPIVHGSITDVPIKVADAQIQNLTNIRGSIEATIEASKEVCSNLSLWQSNVSLDLQWLERMEVLQTFRPSLKTYGNFKYLLNASELNLLQYVEENVPNIYGSIEEFVTYAQSLGKTTGTFDLRNACRYTEITMMHNGQSKSLSELAKIGVVPNTLLAPFSWDAQGNVTWG